MLRNERKYSWLSKGSFQGRSPSEPCCISARINEHYKHSDPIKARKQSAPSPCVYCTAQTTKGAVKPSHKKEASSLPRAGQGALHRFQVKGGNPALLQQLFCTAPHPISTQDHPSWAWQPLFAWQSHSHLEQCSGILCTLPEDSDFSCWQVHWQEKLSQFPQTQLSEHSSILQSTDRQLIGKKKKEFWLGFTASGFPLSSCRSFGKGSAPWLLQSCCWTKSTSPTNTWVWIFLWTY